MDAMSAWWDSVDRTYLFLLLLPVLVAFAGYLRYRWDERKRRLSSGAVLFGFWITLSGYLEPFLVGAGAASAGAVVWLAHRMGLIDDEGHPIHLGRKFLAYLPWLVREIATSAWQVSRLILSPRLAIAPELVRVKASQRTSVGVVTFANSITLTPGTLSVEINDGTILVHALTREGAASLTEGAMDRRVARFERVAA
jgi:multicomponent Na+:H+ antiporter subunit E